MPPNGALHGVAVDRLMRWNLIAICICFLAAHLWLIAAMLRRRRREPAQDQPRSAGLLLTALCVLYIWMAVTAQHLWAASRFEGPSLDAMQVEVVGEQFQWYFRYPGADAAFGSTRPNLVNAAAGNPLGLDTRDAARQRRHRLQRARPPRRSRGRSPPALASTSSTASSFPACASSRTPCPDSSCTSTSRPPLPEPTPSSAARSAAPATRACRPCFRSFPPPNSTSGSPPVPMHTPMPRRPHPVKLAPLHHQPPRPRNPLSPALARRRRRRHSALARHAHPSRLARLATSPPRPHQA